MHDLLWYILKQIEVYRQSASWSRFGVRQNLTLFFVSYLVFIHRRTIMKSWPAWQVVLLRSLQRSSLRMFKRSWCQLFVQLIIRQSMHGWKRISCCCLSNIWSSRIEKIGIISWCRTVLNMIFAYIATAKQDTRYQRNVRQGASVAVWISKSWAISHEESANKVGCRLIRFLLFLLFPAFLFDLAMHCSQAHHPYQALTNESIKELRRL